MTRSILVAGFVLLATLPLSAQEVTIAEFAGEGTTNTRPFVVDGPWEIQWTSGDYIDVIVYEVPRAGADPNYVGIAVSDTNGGEGASYMPTAGRFYLEVTGFGAWTIAVVQIEPAAAPTK